ncbi:hypothetical protein BDN72DRAFT_149142 [Pluteus cervinus]|uniref:Uncharacterized protein n=1 Tax=Pluteus cervinus TaxID=181527 RepID=A0ACD3AL06_9AGAR|nr:hypothetical protein BDN72DRAFT_149142 [Pluteus cervinus]
MRLILLIFVGGICTCLVVGKGPHKSSGSSPTTHVLHPSTVHNGPSSTGYPSKTYHGNPTQDHYSSGSSFSSETCYDGLTRDSIEAVGGYCEDVKDFYVFISKDRSCVSGRPAIIGPIAWTNSPYCYGTLAHVPEDDTTSMGGPKMTLMFDRNNSNSATLFIVADNETVYSLRSDITTQCSLPDSSFATYLYNDTSRIQPQLTDVWLHYRSSTIALGSFGLNNTIPPADMNSTSVNKQVVGLPSNVDAEILACVNATILNNVPLFALDSSGIRGVDLGSRKLVRAIVLVAGILQVLS